jgi:hypothetical protein
MSQNFTCTWHPDERVVESVLTGMWSPADVKAYYDAMRELVAAEASGGQVVILTDLRDYPVQMPEVAETHQAMLPRIKANPLIREVAWVVGGVVASMQVNRSLSGSDAPVAVFHDRDAAWAHLVGVAA